jgi:RNA polymerase sigma-70 factor (ECF subfamily)
MTIADEGLSAFLRVRPRLFGIAYRMLGSAAEADDIVQDVWVRWQMADRTLVRDAAAFLTTTATRLAINVIQSARSRRETDVGPWLPEPADPSADPRLEAERGQALAFGVRLLLEKLTPTERAAYILREAFDCPYRDIANVLRLEEANARQVVTRARQRVANGRRMPLVRGLSFPAHAPSLRRYVTTHLRIRSMLVEAGDGRPGTTATAV